MTSLFRDLRFAVRTLAKGVRLALGAQPADISRLIVGEGMVLALAGLGIGIVAAFGIAPLLRSLLLGVSAADPVIFVAIAALLATVAAVSSYLPARAAAAVDPIVALRAE